MSASARQARVFISYASADLALVARIVAHLGPLRDDLGLIELFWDQDLVGGDAWSIVIDQHLDEADLILLGVSASYFASPHCRAEMARALARHAVGAAKVVPVSLHAVDRAATPLSALNWLPRGALAIGELQHPDLAFAEVARGIRHLATALVAPPAAPSQQVTADRATPPPHLLVSGRRTQAAYLRMLQVALATSLLALGTTVYRLNNLAGSLREARSPTANAQLVDLGVERGISRSVVVNPSRPTNLLLHVFDDGGFDDYAITIRDATGQTCWQSSGLRRTNDGFTVSLPAGSLPEGRYAVELFGVKQDRRTLLRAFDFQLGHRDGRAALHPDSPQP